jgi:hypothetical protein
VKYAVQVGVGVMIYIPSFVKIGSGIVRSEYTEAETGRREYNLPLLSESRINLLLPLCRRVD